MKKEPYPGGNPEDYPELEGYDMTADCEAEWDAERDAADAARFRAMFPLTPEEQEAHNRLVDEVMANSPDSPKNLGQTR